MKLKITDWFRTPSARTIAQRQLEEAERALLDTHAQAEHAQKMAEYYEGVIRRLKTYVNQENSIPPLSGLA